MNKCFSRATRLSKSRDPNASATRSTKSCVHQATLVHQAPALSFPPQLGLPRITRSPRSSTNCLNLVLGNAFVNMSAALSSVGM
jgi:hypothetical protein